MPVPIQNGLITERRFKPHKISSQTTSRWLPETDCFPGLVRIDREDCLSSRKSCETSHFVWDRRKNRLLRGVTLTESERWVRNSHALGLALMISGFPSPQTE